MRSTPAGTAGQHPNAPQTAEGDTTANACLPSSAPGDQTQNKVSDVVTGGLKAALPYFTQSLSVRWTCPPHTSWKGTSEKIVRCCPAARTTVPKSSLMLSPLGSMKSSCQLTVRELVAVLITPR